jgi:hypothetical protein
MNIDSYSSIMNYKFLSVLLIFFITGCLITGCENSNQNSPALQQVIKKYDKATILEGTVSNNEGPIKAGVIKVTDNKGQLVASTRLQNSSHYSVEIPENTVLPIVLTFYPDSDKVGAEQLITAVVHPTITQYDINPLTTTIAKKAKAMGGYNHANMVRAAEGTATVPDANKTTEGFRGDPTTQYGGWH